MSYCQCGGYLGSGGVDGYSGRWCSCASPIATNVVGTAGNVIYVPKGNLNVFPIEEVASKFEDILLLLKEMDSALDNYNGNPIWKNGVYHKRIKQILEEND